MNLVDPIGDMLTRIRNGQMRSLNKIEIPFSKFRFKILEVLKKEGYIIDFYLEENKDKMNTKHILLWLIIKVKEPPPTEPKVETFRTPRLFSFISAIMNPLYRIILLCQRLCFLMTF